MSDLFSGLEEFGLGGLKNVEVFEKEEQKNAEEAAEAKPKITEADLLFDKTHTCPACSNKFKVKTVRIGKAKLISADTDLRPRYQGVDSLKYDAIVCPQCGYSALSRYYDYLSVAQSKLVKETISANFKGIATELEVYSYDDAIARHKLALLSTVVKRGKNSERAFTCLKLAWILRGKQETLPKDTPNYNDAKAKLAAEEADCIKKAHDGFLAAFSNESFPMCGMDEFTTTYLIAELARRMGNEDEAKRWLSKVLTARDANERIKNKAREIKDLMK
ncbi:DUF2225 domain-containing protein [Anaeromicropila populeti]|uniref:DUF2225 domain-containing protein n=1 Tax=Anaeromicropila populeti TaxID=37658 RepID=A0A1I6KR19_9FIRM|nr:DUF2225 domain-containing protein [Anaeromicropila populeti]SFR93350.1 hypothetical protein SAMN05661086_02569 [Anaeromicropila populeti]